MATTRKPELSPGVQATYDRLMYEIEHWSDEKTRESIIETQQRIARYEREHRMSSATMRRKIIAGEIDETWEMVEWAFDLEALDRMILELPKP